MWFSLISQATTVQEGYFFFGGGGGGKLNHLGGSFPPAPPPPVDRTLGTPPTCRRLNVKCTDLCISRIHEIPCECMCKGKVTNTVKTKLSLILDSCADIMLE